MNKHHIKPTTLFVPLLVLALFALSSCKKKVENTSIVIMDPSRHYYAMLQGTDLELSWRIANAGTEPLVLTDIQPSCGCIVEDLDDNNIIPPGKEATLKFVFHTEKNTGYVRHKIRLFGNIKPDGMAVMVFDTNIVPPNGEHDYEELYIERNEKDLSDGVTTLVDGNTGQRGYWTDDNEYSRSSKRYPWREEKR